jgi:hypothetical protein
MRVLAKVVQSLVLPMLHALKHLVLGGLVALELINTSAQGLSRSIRCMEIAIKVAKHLLEHWEQHCLKAMLL